MHPSHLDEPSSEVPPRIKVLLIAYACEPNQGSEPGTGWNLAVGLARYCDVTVVTRANNKGVIERALPTGEGLRLRFVYIDPSAFYLKLKRKKILSHQAFYAIWQVWLAFWIWRDNDSDRYDVIHQVTYNSFEVPPIVFLKKSKAKLVWGPVGGGQTVPCNQLPLFGKKGGVLEFIRNVRVKFSAWNPFCILAVRHADLIYFANPETRQLLARWCKREVRMMIDVGVDTAKFQPRQDSTKNSRPIILFGGRLEGRKGALLLLMALNVLKNKGVLFECHIIGTGPDQPVLNNFIQDNQLQDCVSMLGSVTHDVIADEFRLADIFVFPSLRDTSGAIVLEAMATGLPTVCIDHQGGGEMIGNECGIKIESANIETMKTCFADAIERLINDSSLREVMGEVACKKVCQEYDWDIRISRVVSGYKNILS
jgi:glycosyltransferase involved in cell wall biosynthesis